jgi:hypothetical protein
VPGFGVGGAFGYLYGRGGRRMKLSVIGLGLLVACASALAVPSFAREPTATLVTPRPAAPQTATTPTTGTPKAAPKKSAAKPAATGPGRRGKDDTGSLPEAPSFSADAVGWELIEDARTGVRLGVPEKLVPKLGASRSGTRWSSAQGQIQIETFRLSEAALPALFDEEKKSAHRQIASSSLKPDGFFILGSQGLKNFVVRAATQGGEVRGVTVLYDQATARSSPRRAMSIAAKRSPCRRSVTPSESPKTRRMGWRLFASMGRGVSSLRRLPTTRSKPAISR